MSFNEIDDHSSLRANTTVIDDRCVWYLAEASNEATVSFKLVVCSSNTLGGHWKLLMDVSRLKSSICSSEEHIECLQRQKLTHLLKLWSWQTKFDGLKASHEQSNCQIFTFQAALIVYEGRYDHTNGLIDAEAQEWPNIEMCCLWDEESFRISLAALLIFSLPALLWLQWSIAGLLEASLWRHVRE